jgi:tol-pal system protein YbgF
MANAFIKLIAFVATAFFFATSCASQKDVISLNNRFNALYRQTRKEGKRAENSLRKLEQDIRGSEARQKEIENTLKEDQSALRDGQESLRVQVAQLGADLVGLREDIQTLTGRVEENSHLLKTTIEVDTTKEDIVVSKMQEVSSLVDDLKLRISKIENYFGFETSFKGKKIGPEKAPPVQEMRQKDIAVPGEKQAESGIYDRALGYYREGRYDEAIGMFENFLKLYPKSDLADNAHFWIGECHKDLRKYEEAILAYQRVINDYPNGNKVPAAMLQQAFAFERIDDRTTANLVLKKLVKRFPQTREAEIAKRKLKGD